MSSLPSRSNQWGGKTRCALHKKENMVFDTCIAFSALIVSVVSLGLSIHFWKRSFRPIITAMVRTHAAGNQGIFYNLEVLNSGSLPAKRIRIHVQDDEELKKALSDSVQEDDKKRWLACFNEKNIIPVLLNDQSVKCSFGLTHIDKNINFWKYGEKFSIRIEYEGWFGKKYTEVQQIQILDSDTFTGASWN